MSSVGWRPMPWFEDLVRLNGRLYRECYLLLHVCSVGVPCTPCPFEDLSRRKRAALLPAVVVACVKGEGRHWCLA